MSKEIRNKDFWAGFFSALGEVLAFAGERLAWMIGGIALWVWLCR